MTGAPNDTVDPVELLRRLRPHGGDEYLTRGANPRAEAVLNRITSREIDVRAPVRRARRVVLLVAGLTVVGASAAAALAKRSTISPSLG